MKYNSEGIEEPVEMSGKESARIDQLAKPKDTHDLVWTRRFDQNNRYEYSEVQIISNELQDLFRVELAHDPRMHFSSDQQFEQTLESPFGPLLQNWQRLEELVTEDCESARWQTLKQQIAEARTSGKPYFPTPPVDIVKAKEDLSLLLNQVRTLPESMNALAAMETANTSGTIHFEHLWTIFPPGALVYSANFLKRDQIFVVKECASKPLNVSDPGREREIKKVWYLHC
jgi:hypothetical protein